MFKYFRKSHSDRKMSNKYFKTKPVFLSHNILRIIGSISFLLVSFYYIKTVKTHMYHASSVLRIYVQPSLGRKSFLSSSDNAATLSTNRLVPSEKRINKSQVNANEKNAFGKVILQ